MRRDSFVRYMKDALANYYDPSHLQTHPLAKLLLSEGNLDETRGEALRNLLWETIEALRPPASVATNRPEWLSYRILYLHYVQSVDQLTVCRELGLSERSFYRRLRKALEAVATIMWERYQREAATVSQDRVEEVAGAADHQAEEEAARLALASPRRAVDLAEVLADVMDAIGPLVEQQGITLRMERPVSVPPLYADPAILRQIILNVLTEAIEFAEDTIRLIVTSDEDGINCRVCGLDRSRAFVPSIEHLTGCLVSRSLLRAHGGEVWLQRDHRGVTEFLLRAPIATPVSILIVDDNSDAAELYRRYLQAHAYQVRVACDKAQLDKELAHATPDLILLDVLMPQTDGWSILQRLKAMPETASIPVVICSILSQPRLALALGAAAVLRKPISEGSLLRTIQTQIARRDLPRSANPRR